MPDCSDGPPLCAAEGGGGWLAELSEGTGHAGRGGEAATVGNILQTEVVQAARQVGIAVVRETEGAIGRGLISVVSIVTVDIPIRRDTLPPGVEGIDTEGDVGPDEDKVTHKLYPRVIEVEIGDVEHEDKRGHPLDELGELQGEVISVSIGVLVGATDGTAYPQRHTDIKAEIIGGDDGDNHLGPYPPTIGIADEAKGRQEQGDDNEGGGEEQETVVVEGMTLLREEITLAHDEHLEREAHQSEGVDVEQRVGEQPAACRRRGGQACLHEIRQFKQLQQIYHAHRPLRWKQRMKVVAIRLWLIVPLQQPPVQVGDDKRQIDGEEQEVRSLWYIRTF